ncbi:DotA/TraY family protein [Herbaspirillum seropedicae]|uniref:DotA/TraY family protein n=1 Tax=Herbaspirillum seropedicae TaxID=964 RepID=UPI002857E7EE|nr:DotA/TraY family protein [Herbaspirillum seropedicae]MDR6398037.1 conjugal transfer/type IV secretion protein DotA/TraY [Herbaspirillum seropedicae]
MKSKRYIAGLVTLAALMRSYAAYAQSSVSVGVIQSAANRSGDKSMAALELLWGSVARNPLTGGSGGVGGGMIAEMFLVMSSCILAVSIIWAGYIFLSAVVGTGQDGEFMGQKKSSAWMMIRMVTGFVTLVPVFGGYCGAQIIMLWSCMMGVGIANLTQAPAIAVVKAGGSMVATPPAPNVAALARYVFEANLCAESVNAAIDTMGNVSGVSVDTREKFSALTAAGKVVMMNQNGASCGGAELNLATPQSLGVGALGGDSIGEYNMNGVLQTPMLTAHQTAMTSLQAAMSSEARKFVVAVMSPDSSQIVDPSIAINKAGLAYQAEISRQMQASKENIDSLASKIEQNLTRDGWIMMGAWYQTFAQANAQANSMVNATATLLPGTEAGNIPYTQIMEKVTAAYQQKFKQSASTAPATSVSGDPVVALQKGSSDANSLLSSIFSAPGQSMVRGVISMINSSNGAGGTTNPLIGMKNMGDYILDAGWAATATYVSLKAASGAAEGSFAKKIADVATVGLAGAVSGAIKGALDAVAPFVILLLFTFFFFGATLSVYVPMVPFIVWFGGVMAWLCIVGEAVIASPLWAMTHLDGDGEGMGQRSTHGWVFVLNLMFRPTFMMFGFVLGGALLLIMGTLLNTMFGVSVENAQFNSVTGIVSIVGFVSIYVSLCLTLVHTSFNLIHQVPDQVFAWIGANLSSIKTGTDADDRSKQVFAGGVSHGRGAATSSLGRGGAPKTPRAPSYGAGPEQ